MRVKYLEGVPSSHFRTKEEVFFCRSVPDRIGRSVRGSGPTKSSMTLWRKFVSWLGSNTASPVQDTPFHRWLSRMGTGDQNCRVSQCALRGIATIQLYYVTIISTELVRNWVHCIDPRKQNTRQAKHTLQLWRRWTHCSSFIGWCWCCTAWCAAALRSRTPAAHQVSGTLKTGLSLSREMLKSPWTRYIFDGEMFVQIHTAAEFLIFWQPKSNHCRERWW